MLTLCQFHECKFIYVVKFSEKQLRVLFKLAFICYEDSLLEFLHETKDLLFSPFVFCACQLVIFQDDKVITRFFFNV
jgi:hypothetical protein